MPTARHVSRHEKLSPCAKCFGVILSFMDKYSEQLNSVFLALADPTRRAVIGRLGRGPASITDLARPFEMALPSFMKHIHVLEETGLIETRKQGRVRTCTLEKKRFALVEGWLSAQRAIWEARTDRLEAFVTNGQSKEEEEQ
ncbi:ArsR family transcriptional regulator [Rhizobium sp. BK251]|nr:ArsR family transcriptional regulator [Rhizobium sp. BK251]